MGIAHAELLVVLCPACGSEAHASVQRLSAHRVVFDVVGDCCEHGDDVAEALEDAAAGLDPALRCRVCGCSPCAGEAACR